MGLRIGLAAPHRPDRAVETFDALVRGEDSFEGREHLESFEALAVATPGEQRPEVTAFIDYYLAHARKLAAEVGYIALPEKVQTLVKDRWTRRASGSAFGGHGSQIAVSLEALYGGAASSAPASAVS
jgi:hypothetical protein